MKYLIRYKTGWEIRTGVTRYGDHCGDNDGGDCGRCGPMRPDPDGQWVKYEDIKELVKKHTKDNGHRK